VQLKEIDAMTANNSIDPALFLAEHINRAEPDLLRSMLTRFG